MGNLEERLQEIADLPNQKHPFHIGQPLFVHGDDMNTWIAIGFYKSMLSEWYAVVVPESDLTASPSYIPCSWLCDTMPGEPDWVVEGKNNVVYLSDYRRMK